MPYRDKNIIILSGRQRGIELLLSLLVLSFFLLSFEQGVSAQGKQIDSLLTHLRSTGRDTTRVNDWNELSDASWREGSADYSFLYADSARELANKLGFEKGLATAFRNIGIYFDGKGDYVRALENDFKSLALYQKLGYSNGIIACLDNIGIVYDEEGNFEKALEYYQKALPILEKTGNKGSMAYNLCNTGIVYTELAKYPEALEYLARALKLEEETGDKRASASILGNMAVVFRSQKNYPKALEYNLKVLEINREIGYKEGMTISEENIAGVYTGMGEMEKARMYLDSALALAKVSGSKDDLKTIYSVYSDIEDRAGDYKAALRDFRLFFIYRDSEINEANLQKTVQTEMNFNFEHKQDSVKAVQDRKDIIAEQDRKKQVIVRDSFIVGFIMSLALAFFIFRGYRQKQTANRLLEEKNRIIEEQKEKVDQAYGQLNEKHKEITDSINYAKRIQVALLKEEEHITADLPEHFILFKPRDVVSGDFYWSFQTKDRWYIAAVDCTGHGVPGAFLTMLGTAFLNEICSAADHITPAEILNQLRDKIIEELSGEGQVRDGMDISLASLCPSKGGIQVQWAGANNPLWYLHNGDINEVTADKQPIGFQEGHKPFTNHEISLEKGDILYLFTDGYADQFGGPKGKKYKYARLQEQLLKIKSERLADQKHILEKEFDQWKGSMEQTDDVCIIGIRI